MMKQLRKKYESGRMELKKKTSGESRITIHFDIMRKRDLNSFLYITGTINQMWDLTLVKNLE